MSKKAKCWLVIAASLVVIGSLIFGGALAMTNWDFSLFSTAKYTTKVYHIDKAYTSIFVRVEAIDIVIVPSEGSETTVTCYQPEKVNHLAWVNDGALMIESRDMRKWYDHIGIWFDMPKITISIPAGEYMQLGMSVNTGDVEISKDFKFDSIEIVGNTGDVKNFASAGQVKIGTSTGDVIVRDTTGGNLSLTTATGDICVENVTADLIGLNVSTGDVKLRGIRCGSLETNGNTGSVTMTDVITEGLLSAVRTTGDIRLDKCDGGWLLLRTGTGDIRGSLLSGKVFLVENGTGSVDVPKTKEGGECRVESTTGDIRLKIEG